MPKTITNKRNTRILKSAQSLTSRPCERSKDVTGILDSESRLSPFWSNTPTSGWNEEDYFISAGFQDLKEAQQSLFNQYRLIKKVLSGFPCPEYDLIPIKNLVRYFCKNSVKMSLSRSHSRKA
jgi:hypothetical protein